MALGVDNAFPVAPVCLQLVELGESQVPLGVVEDVQLAEAGSHELQLLDAQVLMLACWRLLLLACRGSHTQTQEDG